MTELEGLKADLLKACREAQQQKVVVAKEEKDLAAEKVARGRDRARVLEVEETLKGVYEACDALQIKEEKASKVLKKLRLAHSKLQTQTKADREVL